MTNLFRSVLSTALIFNFVFGALAPAISEAQPLTPADPAVQAAVLSGEQIVALEMKLVSEIDHQADLVFQEFKKTYPQAPVSFLKKTQRQIVFRLKQMGVLTDILKASGKAPAITLVAGEILPTFVFFPIAAAMGKPLIASAMVTVPWGLIGGVGAFSYHMIKVRRAMAKELEVSSLSEYDKVRKLVVGYDIKNRISSTIYKSLNGDLVEYEILKKTIAPEATKTPSISIPELEMLVKSNAAGASYLEHVFMQKLDPVAYAALLLRFVDSDADLTAAMVSLLSARERVGDADASTAFRKYLMISADVQTQIKREIKKINLLKSTLLKKRVKSLDIWGAETKDMSEHLSAELERLQAVRHQVSRAEYILLIEAQVAMKYSDAAAIEALVSAKKAELKTLSTDGNFVEFNASKVRAGVCMDVFAVAF